MLQDWAFTIPEEREHQFYEFYGTSLVLVRKAVVTRCWPALSLAGTNVPSICLVVICLRKPSTSDSKSQTHKKIKTARCSSLVHVSKGGPIFDLVC